jgi:hypothetical protein
MKRTEQQTLIDLMFEIGIKSARYMQGRPNEDIAEWISKALADAGFPTQPMGLSWGVLLSRPPGIDPLKQTAVLTTKVDELVDVVMRIEKRLAAVLEPL